MQLLVSVRSADEVAPALAGGAQIIDAKEPGRGSLGPVDAGSLSQILGTVPQDFAVSIAMGDFSTVAELRVAFENLRISRRAAASFLKLGFAGVLAPGQVFRLLQTAVSITRTIDSCWEVVAVGYADADRAATVSPTTLPLLARDAGAAAVLIDTWVKDGRRLLDWLPPDSLAEWVARVRQAGLRSALAGSLQPEDLCIIARTEPDIVGTRGAVCHGGRQGQVSEDRVRRFCQALTLGSLGEEGGRASTAEFAKRVTQGRFLLGTP